MTANSEMIFSQISETGSRLYRELCMNLPASAEIPALLTELCRTAAECEYAEVWQLDSQKGELKKLSPGGTAGMTVKADAGLMGKAMRDRQPAAGSSDEYKGYPAVTFRSVLAMPLFSDSGEVTGVLRLINKKGADSFTEWDVRRLAAAALICGSAVFRSGSGGFTDKLTGLRSRGGLLADLAPDGRYGSRLPECDISLFICDIDKLAAINEVYGVSAGDALIRSVADTLAESCRPDDTIYRLGGEEFAAVLPGTKLKDCAGIAESLRLKVQDSQYVVGGESIKVTLSFGCCRFDPALSAEGNISAADAKLFTAKESGRNRVAY